MRVSTEIKRSWYRPLAREVELAWKVWARRELQRKDPTHPDLNGIVVDIRTLEAERGIQT